MKDIIRMNQLAGVITEGQAKKIMTILNEEIKSVKKSFIKEDIESTIDEDNQGIFLVFSELADTDDEGDLYISMNKMARDEMNSEGGGPKGEFKIGNKTVYWSYGYA
jgi:hypothetical protein